MVIWEALGAGLAGMIAFFCWSLRHHTKLPIRVIRVSTMRRIAEENAVLIRNGVMNYSEAVATYEAEVGAGNILWLDWLDIFLEARLEWIRSPEFPTSPEAQQYLEEMRKKDKEGEEWKQ